MSHDRRAEPDPSSAGGVAGHRRLRYARALWPLLWVAYVIAVVRGRHGVYPIFARASERWWSGVPLYPPEAPLDDIYRYSPTFAVAFSPFAALGDGAGAALFNLLSLGLLWAALRTMIRRLLPAALTVGQESALVALTLVGSIRSFWSAQTNALLLALAIFAAVAVLDRRWWTAALLLAATVAIKLWPLALVMLLLTYRPRPLAVRFAAALAALAALPLLAAPWSYASEAYRGYYEVLVRTAPHRWRGYRDAWTVLEQLRPPDPRLYLALQLGGGLAVLAWCQWQRRRGASESLLLFLTLQAWAAWQLLFGPGTERLTYGLIAPFTAAAVVDAFATGRRRAVAVSAFALCHLLGSGEAERALAPVLPWSPVLGPAGVAMFALWLALRYRPLAERPAASGS